MSAGPAEAAAGRGYMPLLLLASSATFLAVLDVTIVNLAIPDLHKDFEGSALADLSWVITAYATVFAALLAPHGPTRGRDRPAVPCSPQGSPSSPRCP